MKFLLTVAQACGIGEHNGQSRAIEPGLYIADARAASALRRSQPALIEEGLVIVEPIDALTAVQLEASDDVATITFEAPAAPRKGPSRYTRKEIQGHVRRETSRRR